MDTILLNPHHLLFGTFAWLAYLLAKYSWFNDKKKRPILNPLRLFEFTNTRRTQEFIGNSIETLTQGRSLYRGQTYRLYTNWGEVLVIPPEFVDDLKSNPLLDFQIPSQDDGHGYIPGFDAFGSPRELPKVVTKYLTKALTKLTEPLSQEASLVLRKVLTDAPDWHEIQPQSDIIRIVSRMSSRVFMGEELCRDDEWVAAAGDYTVHAFKTMDTLSAYPRWVRPILHWFLPSCWAVRSKLNHARRCLKPHIERRNIIKAQALAQGKPSPFNDSIEWFEKEYTKHDPATEQITLSLVAIHTTSDLLTETMFNIAMHKELFQPLREEVIAVLSAEGLKKTALYNLKLMDSVIKETQRMRPVILGVFRRLALEDITLPNGEILKKGTKIVCDSTHQWNTDYYEDAMNFDGYRFFRMRQTPGMDKHAHLVSTSFDHLGFGHGLHSCPGRFFAANEIKIALCHLLLKYDWKLPDGAVPKSSAFGMMLAADGQTKLQIRRRKEELDIDALKA